MLTFLASLVLSTGPSSSWEMDSYPGANGPCMQCIIEEAANTMTAERKVLCEIFSCYCFLIRELMVEQKGYVPSLDTLCTEEMQYFSKMGFEFDDHDLDYIFSLLEEFQGT